MDITEEMIRAFKAAWAQADQEGDEGNRVRRGLEAALSTIPETDSGSLS